MQQSGVKRRRYLSGNDNTVSSSNLDSNIGCQTGGSRLTAQRCACRNTNLQANYKYSLAHSSYVFFLAIICFKSYST
ncbi:hypothetical protein L1987_12326 [Smallanthus sonchifolius]|uniref:Uncharacterized protein n=1 Tax=Smallanthus sonchifolius TaxID=185202 RepID=A0ACB9JGX9_9ASTR|nr:hypothetical protein L1987_12326 [Smallanthus sonchifolius]